MKQANDAPTKSERDQLFDRLRKSGIYEYNKKLLKEGKKESLVRERSQNCENEDVVYCVACLGFYSRTYFSIHRKKCNLDSDSAAVSAQPVRSEVLSSKVSTSREFETSILSKFNKNKIGDFCRSDPAIIMFGSNQFEEIRGRQDKKVELKRSVMTDVRRVGHLFMFFKEKCVEHNVVCESPSDMLRRQNISILKEAIESYTDGENGDSVKWGLKNALYYLVVNFATVHKTTCLVQEQPDEHRRIEEFLEVFKLYQHAWFGNARYNLTKNRRIKLCRPQELPSETDVQKVKQYTLQSMSELLDDEYLMWTSKEYIELRDLIVSRLILFNARRVGEPSRLTLSEWEDAENGVCNF